MEVLSIMTCPLCSAAAQEGATECLSCGVIFAKLRARAERQKNTPASAPETPSTIPLNPRHVRIAAVSLVACWMIGLGLYYHIELNRRPQRGKPFVLEGRSSVNVRDSYGLIGKVPVHAARSGPARPQEPPPPPVSEDATPDPFDE